MNTYENERYSLVDGYEYDEETASLFGSAQSQLATLRDEES